MIVMGLDPGLARLGWGVVSLEAGRIRPVDYGLIETPARAASPVRLRTLYDGVQGLIAVYKPDEIAIEELFFSKNITTGIAVGQARGVILLACCQSSDELYEYTPMQIKQAVTGYGKADKQQMGHMVKVLLGLAEAPKPDDVTDAVAIAICHANSRFAREQFKLK